MDFNWTLTTFQGLVVLFTAFIAWSNYRSQKASSRQIEISNEQIRKTMEQEKSSLLLNCLHMYIDIRRGRTKALNEGLAGMCEDYYRELLDLLWFEYQLWRGGLVDDHIMKSWLEARRRNLKEDKLIANADNVTISYESEWNKLTANHYFTPDDSFLEFMNLVHDGNIEVAMDKHKVEIQ